jgi:hypothetical protein
MAVSTTKNKSKKPDPRIERLLQLVLEARRARARCPDESKAGLDRRRPADCSNNCSARRGSRQTGPEKERKREEVGV